jgi:hypothetical protein
MQQHADRDHARRSAEIKALAPLLARFDECVPLLEARGITVYPEQLNLWKSFNERGKDVKCLLCSINVFGDDPVAQRWLDALLDIGFKVTERDKDDSTYPMAVLKRGHLLLRISVPRKPAAIARLGTPITTLAAAA